MNELDALLKDSLSRATQPADASGVAEAIRSRVASGDTGLAPDGPIFPDGGFGGLLGWLPVVGMIAVAGLVGGAVGASGMLAPGVQTASASGLIITTDSTVFALDCPGGAPVASLLPGERVLATTRTDDSGYLGVRDPGDFGRTVWLPANLVELDEPNTTALPVSGCPEIVVALGTPEPTPEPEPVDDPAPAPAPGPNPAPPPGDSIAPAITQWLATPPSIFCQNQTTIRATATDNVGVTGIAISWTSPAGNGSSNMSLEGTEWRYVYTAPLQTMEVTFTLRARDAAGNWSDQRQVKVSVDCLD